MNANNYVSLDYQTKANYLEKISAITAFVFLAVFPLIISFQKYINITETKYVSFVVISVIYILACGVAIIRCKAANERDFSLKKTFTLPQFFAIAFVMWSIISALFSEFDHLFIGQGRYEGVLSVILYVTLFILMSYWGEYVNKITYGITIMALPVSIVAIIQIMGGKILYPSGINYGTASFLTTIGNIDCVSGFIAILLPLLFVSFVYMSGKLRYLNLTAVVLLTYVQSAMDVDSGKLGVIAAAIVLLPFVLNTKTHMSNAFIILGALSISIGIQKLFISTYDWNLAVFSYVATHNKFGMFLVILGVILIAVSFAINKLIAEFKLSAKKISAIVAIILAVGIIIAAVYIFAYSGTNPLLMQMSEAMHGNLSDEAGSGRGVVWKRTILLIKEHSILGSGTGSFLAAFAPYNEGLTETFDFAHNDFLNIAACQGLVGLALYLGFIISLAVRAFKNVFKCPMVLMFIAPCVGYLVHSFFSFSIAIVTPLFWVIAGLLDHMIRQIPADAEGTVWPREELALMGVIEKPVKKEEKATSSKKNSKSKKKNKKK